MEYDLEQKKDPDDVPKVIIKDEKKLKFEERKNINEQLKPFIKMHLESQYS